MSDAVVAAALRSAVRLVVIEAPGGYGKTYQAASFAADVCPKLSKGRLLVLTHTHAACGVFADRTRNLAGIEIRTIDSLINEIADAYPNPGVDRGLVPNFEHNAKWAAFLLQRFPFIAGMLAQRYPVVICDEHQDASAEQDALVKALHAAGASMRVFGDPMQRIHASGRPTPEGLGGEDRWVALQRAADITECLDVPHRWRGGGESLGEWIRENRANLKAGGKLRLKGALPAGLRVIFAENIAQRNLGFQLDASDRRKLDSDLIRGQPVLIVSHHRETVRAIRAFFGRSMPIWEGHTRLALQTLVERLGGCENAVDVADSAVNFVTEVCTGFTKNEFGAKFHREIASGCAKPSRGKTAKIQALARCILERPDHLGVSDFLRALHNAIRSQPEFGRIRIDYPREFWDAVRLGDFPDLKTALSQLSHLRSLSLQLPPNRTISTIHKAKGLEAPNVLILPCDSTTFREKDRHLLYVAISRATRRLTMLVSRSRPSPIIEF